MANTAEGITCGGFVFYNNFDSANLAKVEQVKDSNTTEKDVYDAEGKSCKSSNSDDSSEYEFNLWTKHDCHGTQFENNNRTWFHFGIKAALPGICVKLNVVNLNKQVKMFSQGMCPVFKIVPGHPHWERIREKPSFNLDQKGSDFTLSFHYYVPENPKAVTYFAFTYPFSYTDLQNYLRRIDMKMAKRTVSVADDIYYHRECAIKSLEGRRLDVLTISSYHNISTEREDRLKNLFPEKSEDRSYKFWDKKVVLVSARVHPGETPSSFVLNGFLNFLLNREDQIAINLRRLYVFKLIPMLNPDGVAKGHYRMDTRGVNLNRVYLNPSEKDHPTIYAATSLIKYYHLSYKLPEDAVSEERPHVNLEIDKDSISIVTLMTLDEKNKAEEANQQCTLIQNMADNFHGAGEGLSKRTKDNDDSADDKSCDITNFTAIGVGEAPQYEESGLFLYIDLHGHASKKGVFMYGNHFDDPEDTITCMLLPKLMSINNPNFHFTSCNFAERNMYLIDKRDGMSREGSGRVAVYKMTGLVRSYTLECNYNSGRLVNTVPPRIRDGVNRTVNHVFVPPKYTPSVFEAVGAALGPSILDLTNSNPNSRLPNSQYRCLRGVKSYLKLTYANNFSGSFNRPLHKENSGVASQDFFPLKELESKESCDSTNGAKESLKIETNLVKKPCIIRRSTSLYATMKRLKGNKKVRQTPNRRAVKSQSINNIQSSTINRTIRSSAGAKVLFKTCECKLRNSITADVIGREAQSKGSKCFGKKPSVIGDLPKEETTVVKQGAKRLKIVSMKISKTRPEIGESSNAELLVRKSPPFLCEKQRTKGNTNVTRNLYIAQAQSKRKKSSKLKEKNDSG